jgi:copper transport protein
VKKILAGAAVVAVAFGALVAGAGPAAAHASLESTSPGAGAVLAEAPTQVSLTYSEPVEVSLGAVRVYDSNAERVDEGGVRHDGGDTVVQPLDDLVDGSYVVTWRVVSTDGHPIHGAFTFQVGDVATGDTDALARRLLAADGGSEAVGVLFAVVRFLVFASLVLLVGAAAFCLLAWPEGLGLVRVRHLLWWAWGVAVGATVVSVGAQGAYVGALPLGEVVDVDVVSSVFDSRYGRVALGRVMLLVVAGLALVVSALRPAQDRTEGAEEAHEPTGDGPSVGARVALALLGVALLLTLGLSGHAAAGDLVPLALTTDLVHVGAAGLWLGGLVVVLAVLLPRARPDELRLVVPRFSSIAFAAVAALVVSGVIQSWRQVGSLEALTETTYGTLLLAKLALFVVMVAFGYLGRRWVQRGYRVATGDAGDAGDAGAGEAEVVAGYRRSIRVETVLGVAILAVTALLVNAQPARSALAQPYAAELVADDLLIDLTIDPAKAGPTEIHVYTLTPTGAVAEVEELTLSLTLPSRDIGPLEVPLERAGPGHFSAYDVEIPLPGEWTVDVQALVDEFTEATAQDTIEVRGR